MRISTASLEAEFDLLDGHDCTSFRCATCTRSLAIERELDARDAWNSDDARVREAVGNYR